jgi:DnaJ domain
MDKFYQLWRRGIGLLLVMGFLTGVVVIGFAVHQIVGWAAVGLILAWMVWVGRRPDRDWDPDVRGENAYQILGVSKSADAATLRRAFRRLQQQYHPDAAPADRKAEATALFIRIGQAYELLAEQEKRFQYDGLIHDLDGRIPPFTEAYERIKDEDKHPIYAEYDALYGDRRRVGPGSEDEHSEPAARDTAQAPAPPPVGSEAGPGPGEPAGPALEVEMPEAVREALGLPPNTSDRPRNERQ